MQKKRFLKILSIDGGGIKGLYSSTILQVLEERYNCKTYECFDMLCGTSTGGLIALALSAGKTAKEISEMYINHGASIFPQKWNRLLKQIFGGGKYSNEFLKSLLERFFGNKTLNDSENLLCIPSFNYTESVPWIFKYDHKEGQLARDKSIKYVDVALATSAAPTYFPICEIEALNKQYIDGGVWANNPVLIGLIEALCYFVGNNKEYDSIQVLSISSIDVHTGKPLHKNIKRGAIKWGLDTLNPFMKGQIHFPHNSLNLLAKHSDLDIEYKRIESPSISTEQAKFIGMDTVSKKSIELIQGLGKSMADNCFRDDDIKKFFSTQKTYKTK
ncbi:MAG: patatin-like phospholipase family protein [Bacteroidales bacterium]